MGPGGPCQEDDDVCKGEVALPGLVPTSRSIVLFVHPGQVARVAPVMRKVTFLRVMLPCTGPVPTRLSLVLLV